ncbi:MAG: Hsp20/alpha crystallin family protein [Thermoleophilaceae bacterium]|nr:Hsp20/alpha crystallin family protein [Thermoleophilaceae bacterium]
MMFEPLLEFDRLMNRAFTANGPRSFLPPADVVVTDDDVTVYMDVPGLTPDGLEIELENDVLTVRGERVLPHSGQNGRTRQRIERGFGRFERSLRVPRGLDPNAVGANLTDGVLVIRIPKPEALKPHRVEIGAGGARELEASTT